MFGLPSDHPADPTLALRHRTRQPGARRMPNQGCRHSGPEVRPWTLRGRTAATHYSANASSDATFSPGCDFTVAACAAARCA
jgi:hypothetical protein